MVLEIIILIEDREKQILYGITYMWNLKKKGTSELIYKNRYRGIDAGNKLMVTRELGASGERDKLGDWD